jgi:hypothetical protein
MPFDGLDPFKPNRPDLSKPSLAGLAYLLRNPEQWPVGFQYSFPSCRTCAMALACITWDLVDMHDADDQDIIKACRDAFRLSHKETWWLFFDGDRRTDNLTVAKRIQAFAAGDREFSPTVQAMFPSTVRGILMHYMRR